MDVETILSGTFGGKRHYINRHEDSMILYIEDNPPYM